MAKSLGERKIKVSATTKGVTGATKQVKGLGKATTATALQQNVAKRKQESLHKETINTSKAFSKQQQGLGGLVRAYATIAANIFALTAAYGLLKRAADFQSMLKSTDNLESRMGTSVSNIAKEMQKASGHALDFRQSIESTNRALSAGFNQSQISELTDVVARASQTFGGSVDANMNKAINAVLRGRTETLATMGIVIDLNRAYLDYGATIGKTVGDLSKYEQQQAVINALLTTGQKNLEGIELDPNPFMKLANTLFDTAQDVTTAVVKITEPLINLVNTSKQFAGMIIATLAAVFVSKLTPDASGYFEAASRAAKQSSVNISKAASLKIKAERTFHKESKVLIEQARESKRQEFIAFVQAERNKVQDVSKSSKTMQALFRELETAGKDAFINIEGEQRRALGTMQGNLTRYINDTSDKSVMPAVKDLGSVEEAKRIRNAADSLAGENRKLDRDIQKTTASMGKLRAAWTTVGNQAKLTTNSMTRSFAMQRRSTHSLISQYGLLTGTMRAWRLVLIGAEHDTRRYVKANGFLGRSFKVLAVSIRGAAFAMTLFARALNALPWLIGMITTAMFAWKWIADKLGIGKISKELEAFNEALETLTEVIGKNTKRMTDYNAVVKRTANDGLAGLAQQATHLKNSLIEVISPIEEMGAQFTALITGPDGRPVSESINDITEALVGLGNVKIVLPDLSEWATKAAAINAMNAVKLRDTMEGDPSQEAMRANLDQTILRLGKQMGISGDLESVISIIRSYSTVTTLNFDEIRTSIPGMVKGMLDANKAAVNLVNNATKGAGPELIDKQIKRFGEIAVEQNTPLARAMAGQFQQALRSGDEKALTAWLERQLGAAKDAFERVRVLGTFNLMKDSLLIDPRAASTEAGALAAASTAVGTLMTDVLKLRETKGDTFISKAGTIEEVRILRGLSNAFKDVAEASREEFSIKFKENKELMSFLGLKGGEDFGQLASTIDAKIDTFRRFAENLVFAPMDEEIRKSQAAILKIGLDRTIILDEIIDKTQSISELAKESIASNIYTNQQQINILGQQIAMNGVSAEQARHDAKRIEVLEEQNKVLAIQRDLINPVLDGQLAGLRAIQEVQNARLASLNVEIGAMQQLLGLAGDTNSIYKDQAEIFKKRSEALGTQRGSVETQVQTIKLKVDEGDVNIEDLNKLISLESQVVQLMAQQIALNRAEQRTNLRNLARSDEEGNFQAKQRSFMLEFVTAGEELARTMVDSGARAARHISTVIQNTFGMIVDKLLDGSRDFLEAFKDILRDTLGEFIKTNINNAMTSLLGTLFKKPLAETDPATMANTTAIGGLTLSIEKLILTMQGDLTKRAAVPVLDTTKPLRIPDSGEKLSSILNPSTDTSPTALAAQVQSSTVVDTIPITQNTLALGTLNTSILGLIAKMDLGFATASIPDNTSQLASIVENTRGIPGIDIAAEAGNALSPIHAIEQATLTSIATTVSLMSVQVGMAVGFLQTIALNSAAEGGSELFGMVATAGMGSIATAADGAIFKGMKRYANGGIVRQPELALIGEGRNHEAVIPMPNNKEVPVQLLGSNGNDVNVTNVYDFRNADPASETRLRANAEKLKKDTFDSVFAEINKGGSYAKMVGRRK